MAKPIKFEVRYLGEAPEILGARFTWSVQREKSGHWYLTTQDGAEHFVGMRWLDVVARVNLIAENYGCETTLSWAVNETTGAVRRIVA